MNLPDTWNNYKCLLGLTQNNNEYPVKDFLSRMCSPFETLTNSKKLTQLFALAVELKNCEIVSLLLQHGVRGKSSEELFKYTPMQRAVMLGDTTLILEMAQCGVTYDDIDNDGNTLLHLAMVNKNERWKYVDENCSKAFLKFETEEKVANTLRILLDLGLNVNAVNKEGESPLSLAVKYRMKAVTELLVDHDVVLNIFDKSVSHFLIMDEVESFRREEKNPNLPEYNGLGMQMQNQDYMEWWFAKKLDINCPINFETPLQLCARYNMKNIMDILLKYTNEINVVDAVGRTLLHILIGSIESSSKIKGQPSELESTVDMVILLIEKGISVNEIDKNGNTAFHIAGKLKIPEIMQIILERFTNVDACNKLEETPLHVVVKNCCDENEKQYYRIVRELVRKRADIDCQDRFGNTPLHYVVKDTKICRKIFKFLVEQGCDVNMRNEKGVTPLYLAIQNGIEMYFDILMNNGAEVNFCEKNTNSTPLHEATKNNLPIIVRSLLEADAEPDIRDNLGQTPLHIVVSDLDLNIDMLSLMLMFGADVEVLDKDKKSPLQRAFESNNYDRVELLLDFGAKITMDRATLTPSRSEAAIYTPKTLLIKHLVARSLAGLPIKNCHKVVVQRARLDFVLFYDYCTQELELIKSTTIDDVSLYDLMHMSFKRRSTYVTKDSFKGFMTDYEYLKDKFPVYRHIISASYWTAVKRKPLFDRAKEAWYELASVSLPEMCVEMILKLLENSDLKFLAQAAF